MKPEIPLPGKLDFETWANLFIANYPTLNIPFPKYRKDWKEWGNLLINIPEFSNIPTPIKEFYKDNWQDWAILAISNLK